MSKIPQNVYLELMIIIRSRLDLIKSLKEINTDSFSKCETAAFHGRKIVEGIAFGCLVATEHGLKEVPRSAKGQWNAEKLLKKLKAKNISTFPSPSIIRDATDIEKKSKNLKAVVEGIPENRISVDELISIYQGLHRWLHEVNPYVKSNRESLLLNFGEQLWENLSKLDKFMDKHFIAISGEGFLCVLRDSKDGITKIISLSKVENT